MANEWTKVELLGPNRDGEVRRFTIADGTPVSKGTLMELTDPRTVTVSDGASAVFAGVTMESKNADDGATSIGCWTQGVFEVSCSGGVTLGYPVTGAGTNQVKVLADTASGATVAALASVIGQSFETGADAEVINVRLDL